MAVVEDGVVGTVGPLDLIEGLGDQEGPHPVAGHERQSAFEKVETAKDGQFIEHQQHGLAGLHALQAFGETADDLVEQEPDQRLGAADVGRRHHQVEGAGAVIDQIADAPVATRGHRRDHGIPVETQERHGGGKHARALVVALVQELTRRAGHYGVGPVLLQMRRAHHQRQRLLDGSLRVR